MTPEERFEAHEQWLLDHDKRMAEMQAQHAAWRAEIDQTFREIGQIQRQQSAVLLEIAQHVARLLDREDGR